MTYHQIKDAPETKPCIACRSRQPDCENACPELDLWETAQDKKNLEKASAEAR